MLATAVDDLVEKLVRVSSGTSLRLRTTRCHSFPANMQHWHIRASYIPTKENRGIHLCLTILRFESIEKIGASRRRASIPPPTGFYGESKDLSSQSIIVFGHNIFIEPLDDCRHAKTTIASTKRPTQKSSPSLHSLGRFYLAYATYGSLRHKKKAGTIHSRQIFSLFS